MKKAIFIQSNNSQRLGALLSKYSFERFIPSQDLIEVHILQVENIPEFQQFEGKTYKQGSEIRTFSLSDEQSFTLTRFMPPQLMNYEGRAIVVDPDVFAVRDPRELFELELDDAVVACCDRADGKFYDTSMMLIDCNKARWGIDTILKNLHQETYNYNKAIRYIFDEPAKIVPRIWNQLDELSDETKLIHMTHQRTQPWKTGLRYSVTHRKLGKIFGMIPKEWLPYGQKKYPSHYQEHERDDVKAFFFTLVKDALQSQAITKAQIEEEINRGHIRPDIFEKIRSV